MNEQQWLTWINPAKLIRYVHSIADQHRRLLWFNCACCRRIWNLLGENSRQLVEIVERYAGDTETPLPPPEVHWEGEKLPFEFDLPSNLPTHEYRASLSARMAARCVKWPNYQSGDLAATAIARLVIKGERTTSRVAEQAIQSRILRDIFGNPFHRITTSSTWLAWNGGIVVRLAQAAYDERILPAGILDNTRLLILADALEEAGCTDEQILTHLRGGGEHYRGCWVLDLLLGKQ